MSARKKYTADLDSTPILGYYTCVKFGIIKSNSKAVNAINKELWLNTIVQGIDMDYVKRKYSDWFTGPGCFEKEYDMKLKPNAQPVAHAPRRVSHALLNRLKHKLYEIIQSGIIEK